MGSAFGGGDMATGPDGERLAPAARIAEIKQPFRQGELVTRYIARAEPEIWPPSARLRDG